MKEIIDARTYVINELGNKVSELRVIKELALMNEKNFMEVYYAKKVSDFLKANNEYYIVRGIYGNLYINYLLGITDVEPYELPYELPYEFVFDKTEKSFIYEFNVSVFFEPQLIDYINEISGGIMVRTVTSCLIPYTDQIVSLEDYVNKCHDKLIEIGVMGLNGLYKLNENIKKYGLPKYDILKDSRINKEIFDNLNIDDLTYCDDKNLKKCLSLCDKDVWNFKTYVYLLAGAHGRGLIDQFGLMNITKESMEAYPTTREDLYNLLLLLRTPKEKALKICRYTRLGRSHRCLQGKKVKEWRELVSDLPSILRGYLNEIESIFPKYHIMAFARMNYLEVYYKLLNEEGASE